MCLRNGTGNIFPIMEWYARGFLRILRPTKGGWKKFSQPSNAHSGPYPLVLPQLSRHRRRRLPQSFMGSNFNDSYRNVVGFAPNLPTIHDQIKQQRYSHGHSHRLHHCRFLIALRSIARGICRRFRAHAVGMPTE